IICACKEHDETIETVGDAAMRRCTVCECFKEESELLVSFLIGEAECSEHSFLKFFIMYTYRTATEFVAVQYNIVCICPDFFRGGFQFVRSEEHTSELQSRFDLVCRLLLEKKKKT